MSHPTCYCWPASLDRCDRCDLLVGLEGFHLVAVARRECGLVLDIESCDRCADCPGCGVITQGHGRVVVEVIDAPWAGIPARIRWHKRCWRCLEKTCQTVTFLEHDERVCAPRARLGARAIRWAIRQLRFEGATIAGLARQLATTWNTVWSHIKPCLQAASDDPARFAGVRVLGVDEHVWHHQDRRRRGPRELTGIVDHSRGGSSHGKVVGPGPRKVWHCVQELARRARRTVSLRYPDRDAGSLPGTARTPLTINSKTPPASSMPSILSSSLATPQVRCVAASSKTRPVTAGARVIPSIRSGFFCAPRVIGSRSVKRNASVRPSWQMRRISVSKSPTFTGQVREVFHQDTPAQGQRLAAHLIESLPACPIPEIARLGRTLRKWKDALDAYFDTGGASNGPTEAINGIIELGRRTARGYRNPTNYQPRMPLIAGGLDASTHTQL